MNANESDTLSASETRGNVNGEWISANNICGKKEVNKTCANNCANNCHDFLPAAGI